MARAGPRLEPHIAEIERGAAEIKGHDVVEFVISRADTHARQRSSNRALWLGCPFEAFEQRQGSVPAWYIRQVACHRDWGTSHQGRGASC